MSQAWHFLLQKFLLQRKRAVQDTEGRIPSPLGYSAVPIKFSEKQQASHYLYVREHRVREGAQSTWPQKRTLFVLNVPRYCSEESLSRLLSPCGLVQSVELQEKPDLAESPKEPKSKFFHPRPVPGFRVAYVVFQRPSGVAAALILKGPLLVSTESHPVPSGIHEWISDYADAVADPEALRVEVDAFMEAYDKKTAEEETEAKGEEGVPDKEGWVKVTRRGRRPVLPRTEAASLRVLERERRKRARKELLNFYAWQHRETKMEYLVQLRKKFEEDKQRIELLRAQRKFRPTELQDHVGWVLRGVGTRLSSSSVKPPGSPVLGLVLGRPPQRKDGPREAALSLPPGAAVRALWQGSSP